jgi:hypothetical protein
MLRMSHEGERAIGDRIHDRPDRAPPHWLNPFVRRFNGSHNALTLRPSQLFGEGN